MMLADVGAGFNLRRITDPVLSDELIRSKIVIRDNKACVDDAYLLILGAALKGLMEGYEGLNINSESSLLMMVISALNIYKNFRRTVLNIRYRNQAAEMIKKTEKDIARQRKENHDELIEYIQYTTHILLDKLETLNNEYEKRYRNL